MQLDVWLKKRSCIVLKDAIAKKLFANEQFYSLFTFSAGVVLPSDCILSFLFPVETDVLVPVLSRSTDFVVMNFVVVLKFPNILWTTLLPLLVHLGRWVNKV